MTLLSQTEDDGPLPIRIGEHEINAGSAPYVIAEAGVNHDGRLDRALSLVDAAAASGADAVKFQVFSADSLASGGAPCAAYQAAGSPRSQREMLAGLELTPDDFAQLARRCSERGITFLATPFSEADLQMLVELRAPAIKIASTDLNNLPLLEAAIATDLPMFLSTGAAQLSEIDEAVSFMDHHEACDRLLLLHCVSCYPTPLDHAAISTIAMLSARYALWSGYSDHTDSVEIGGLAVAAGARLLEKHLTLDGRGASPDHRFSLTPDRLVRYIQGARLAWTVLGEPRRGVWAVEQEVRRLSRRSIVARVAIGKGTPISRDLVAIQRPAGGLEPAELSRLLGRTAARDIPADTRIDWSMIN